MFFLYGMKGWKAPTSIFAMAAAGLGDLAAAIVLICLSALSLGRKSAAAANRRMLVGAVMLGALTGIMMEWSARVAHLWNYTALMPVVRIVSVTVGVVPVFHMALLPALSLLLAARNS